MKKRWISGILASVMAMSLLAGCGGGQTSTGDTTTAAADTGTEAAAGNETTGNAEAAGNVLRYVMTGEPETLDPNMNNYAESSNVLLNLFTGLYQYSTDGTSVEPGCAESHTVSDDGLTYTFKLREGLKWSDGSPLTAADFEYSWKRELKQETASTAAWQLYYIKNGEAYNNGQCEADEVGVKAIDDTTLEVVLNNPTPYFVNLTAANNFAPVKKEAVESAEAWTKSADTYVCNGPFMMAEIKPQEGYSLVKNPNYVFADTVALDGVEMIFIEQAEAALSAYNAGDVDAMSGKSIETQAMTQYDGSEELHSYDLIGTSYYDFNCEKEYMTKEVRKALAMAISRDTINQVAVPSKPKSAYAFVPYGIPYAEETEDFRTKVGNDMIIEDVEAAKQLLADAGYPGGEGLPTLQLIITNTKENKDKAQILQAVWKENLGVNVEIVTFESKVYWDEHGAGNFDVAFDGWTGDYPDPNTNLSIFNKSRMEKECRWRSEEALRYNDLLEEAATLADNNARMDLFVEMEQILMDEMPVMPVYFRNTMALVKPHVQGFTCDNSGHPLFRAVSMEK
ncbi:MAG: peptide ABC transporter substrate-binding protein [Lachnospiraceae bacterium]|nr:peptide ABC transporter substrate-binding protein [Lachnospiraceae bacterium]